jgi:hypothetical protein
VTRATEPEDKLVLKGSWEVNKNNEISYTYSTRSLKSGRRRDCSFTLKGFWDIAAEKRIFYVLSRRPDSRLAFRVSMGRPTKRGLQYRIGAGACPQAKTIILFGHWKLDRRLGLVFEMSGINGRFRRVVFGSYFRFDNRYNLDFALKDGKGRDRGVRVKLSRKMLKSNGELFVSADLSRGRRQLMAGVAFRF